MKKTIYILVLLSTLVSFAKAQETTRDKAALAFLFVNTSTDYGTESIRGGSFSPQVKLYGYEGVRLEAAGEFTVYATNGQRVYVPLGGPQISVDLFHKRLTPFGRLLFGATHYEGATLYTHGVDVGLDVNVTSRLFFRGTYGKQTADGLPPFYVAKTGLGVRF